MAFLCGGFSIATTFTSIIRNFERLRYRATCFHFGYTIITKAQKTARVPTSARLTGGRSELVQCSTA